MPSNKQLVIHIGAPRTGTSFLRKEIFPRLSNVEFTNKQLTQNKTTKYFESIAHYGDGDELSFSLSTLADPEKIFSAQKTLISEEHLLWSVYHLFGNVGSRALLLKRIFPNARIIISIRRQPEFLHSVFSYLNKTKTTPKNPQLKNLWQFVNYAPEITDFKIKKLLGIPSGLEWTEIDSIFDINSNYFNREARHFISADFSWFRLYQIYEAFFGAENILLLPQEIWAQNPMTGISLLENFLDENVDTTNINFEKKINKNQADNHITEKTSMRFSSYIQSLVWQDNKALDEEIPYLNLDELGYTEPRASPKNTRSFGIGTLIPYTEKSPHYNAAALRKMLARMPPSVVFYMIIKKIIKKMIKLLDLKQETYRLRRAIFDRLNGLDFEKIESISSLQLDPENSEQYEGSKAEEIKALFSKIQLPASIRFMDLGSGKGRVVCYISQLKNTEISRGVEISKKLCDVSEKNISILKCKNTEIINSAAENVSKEILDDTNVFYFYNPFPSATFYKVITSIFQSFLRNPRDLSIIYFNPTCNGVIEEIFSGLYTKQEYSNKISNASTLVYWIECDAR